MRKAKKISFLIFWFVFISIIAAVSSQLCNNTWHFDRNSTYDTNRELIFTYLSSNVTSSGGSYNSSVGQGINQVYAMGMCINGSEQALCSECIEIAFEQLKYNCPNQTEAFTWTPHKTLCFARYSNISFFERHDDHPLYSEHSTVDIMSYIPTYVDTWRKSMNVMKDKAQDRNGSFYDKVVLKGHLALYGIMQCTPDLSPPDCGECLGDCVSFHEGLDFKGRGSKAGIIAYPSCYFQWDLYPFIEAFNSPPPPGCPECKKIKTGVILGALVSTAVIASVLSVAVVVFICRRRKTHPPEEILTMSSLQYDLKTIEAATCTFSRRNILGKGGFGEVFKGVLQDGSEIAVKRLSTESAQGVQEFKNETSLVSKLQHRNLVSVLGFCMEGDEKILVYEFVPNKSLDHFLFEPTRQGQLDWAKRYEIILGTAKGIQYLHYDSPLKIIHRDLKASNILLDAVMKPKVADFGMARILEMDQSRADTRRVVGTHGYISPEYMMHGQFSMKSDVYSFGVLVLEIISGKRNSNFHENENSSGKNLVMHAWKHWRNGSPLVLVDAEMGTNYQSSEIIRCIHIALLCVQNVPEKRPYISGIISMLTSDSTSLPVPDSPVYRGSDMGLPTITSVPVSTNDSLINDLVPR